MTTQLPYPPQQQQPHAPAYSTAPPWATPPVAPTEPADQLPPPAPFGDPYTAHGQLLVPFPEEMQAASRPTPPSWWPVVLWTFFFGLLALISVIKRAGMAQRGRNSVAPYWIAWGATMVVGWMLGAAMYVAAVPAYLNFREDSITQQLQTNIVKDGSLTSSAHVTATSANCDPMSVRDATGLRLYDCVLTLDDGRTRTLKVIADTDSTWSAVPPATKKK
jgi:hypothetical protein